jgi:hypothetical protein
VRVESCEDRYAVELGEESRGQLRLDFTTKVGRVAGEESPFLGLIAAVSATGRTDLKPTYSLAVGPTIHPADAPSQILGGALLEIRDFTNANGQHPGNKKLFVRLYVGLPFSVFK